MLKRALLAASLVAFGGLAACDSDGDGLKNGEEKDLGYDPKNDDMDGDGLLDGEDPNPLEVDADMDRLDDMGELEAGTDPNNPDTDGDGYFDGDEVLEGSDPTDPKSKIYKGGWPYNPFKDDLGKAKVTNFIEVGGRVPRLVMKDQHGQRVDIYDFAGQGKNIIIDMSGENCGPCLSTADWLSTGNDAQLEGWFGDLREGIRKEDVYWVTLAYTSYYPPSEASKEISESWDEAFPNKKIPVLADEDLEFWDYAYQGGMPWFALVNDKMIVQSFDMGIGPSSAPLADAQDAL